MLETESCRPQAGRSSPTKSRYRDELRDCNDENLGIAGLSQHVWIIAMSSSSKLLQEGSIGVEQSVSYPDAP